MTSNTRNENVNCQWRILTADPGHFGFAFFSILTKLFGYLTTFSWSVLCRQWLKARPQQVQLCFEGKGTVRCSHIPVIPSFPCMLPLTQVSWLQLQALSSLHKAVLQIRTCKVKALRVIHGLIPFWWTSQGFLMPSSDSGQFYLLWVSTGEPDQAFCCIRCVSSTLLRTFVSWAFLSFEISKLFRRTEQCSAFGVTHFFSETEGEVTVKI